MVNMLNLIPTKHQLVSIATMSMKYSFTKLWSLSLIQIHLGLTVLAPVLNVIHELSLNITCRKPQNKRIKIV